MLKRGGTEMKTKKVFTANLVPGMVIAEAAYTIDNHLVIQSNTEITEDIIDKLKYYSIKTVRIYLNEPNETNKSKTNKIEPTYFERIEQSEDFKKFKNEFNACLEGFQKTLNNIIIKSSDGLVDEMLSEIESVLEKSRNPLHLLEMMQCMRGYDDLTYTHSINVALISNVIGTWMNLGHDDIETLMIAGMLHDIGKVQVPPEILEKPGPLTETEFDVIKMHSKNGYEKLKNNVLVTSKIKMGVYMHHENINGTGYPMGLEGEQIYKFARIIHVADVYDAITSRRVYKKAQSPNEAVDFLIRNSGAMFDPECVKAFVTYIPVYPKGRNVILSDGEVAVVVENRQQHTLYPVVRRLSNGETLDLSLHEIPNLKILGFQDI